jgi:hypothetical protein
MKFNGSAWRAQTVTGKMKRNKDEEFWWVD